MAAKTILNFLILEFSDLLELDMSLKSTHLPNPVVVQERHGQLNRGVVVVEAGPSCVHYSIIMMMLESMTMFSTLQIKEEPINKLYFCLCKCNRRQI